MASPDRRTTPVGAVDGTRVSNALIDRVRGSATDIVALATRLVGIPSDGPAHDERAIVAALQRAAVSLGLPAGRIVAAHPERPNLLIEIEGRAPGPGLALIGHTDTKPVGDPAEWRGDPRRPAVIEGRLGGLGSADMKGAVAAMLHAAAALRAEGLPARGVLTLCFTADEEGTGQLGLQHVLDQGGLRADMAIIGEPSGTQHSFDTLPLGSRGFYGFRLEARGRRRHSALAAGPEVDAVAALLLVAELLPRLIDFEGPFDPPFEAGPTLTITALEAGVAPGIAPGTAIAKGDVRTVVGQTQASVTAAIERALTTIRAAHPVLEIALTPNAEDWPPMRVPDGSKLAEVLARAVRLVIGRDAAPGIFPGASEAHVLAAHGIDVVPAFGPGLLSAAHAPDESVAVADLVDAAAIYALVAAESLG